MIRSAGGVEPLRALSASTNDRIRQQATRALMNLGEVAPRRK